MLSLCWFVYLLLGDYCGFMFFKEFFLWMIGLMRNCLLNGLNFVLVVVSVRIGIFLVCCRV